MPTVDHKLAEIALEYAQGTEFELFFQAFYSDLTGTGFVPLGGVGDGGADGFQGENLFETKSKRPGSFYQATTQKDHRSKIRQTIKRLCEFERAPTSLVYFTSQVIPNIDKDEESLSIELDVFIKIRDRKWIVVNINKSPATVAAFNSHLKPAVAFLGEIGGSTIAAQTTDIDARTICVFLGQEVERRRGNTDLLESVTDSLILWALEGTDPDRGVFLERHEILTKIEATLPSAKQFVRGAFDHRLELLASKKNKSGREVRWHKKEDKFCLPYETRKIVELENTEDEFLKIQVLTLFKDRADRYLEKISCSVDSSQVAHLAHRAIELTFEKEGLELAAFISDDSDQEYYGSISDQVDDAIIEMGISGEDSVLSKDAALDVIRQSFYSSTKQERVYFGKLTRTYTLLFTLRNEPKVVEYFKSMSSNFVLFIGSDIIIRALSERYLDKEDQMTVNMLRILRDAGADLILTDISLSEVHHHLVGTDWEFKNYFMELEPYVDRNVAQHADKILVRAYFYAKLNPLTEKKVTGWRSFMEQICNYDDLHTSAGREQIKIYLQQRFGFEFASEEDLKNWVDEDEVQELAKKIEPIKKEVVLAANDAFQILAVYGKRKAIGEQHRPNPFGYRTWWLTHETRVRQRTGHLVQERGSQYIMRPEFILNFIALSPSTEEVRRSYNTIFPTLLGVRLSNRMRDEVFHDVMNRTKKVKLVDEARAQAMMTNLSNRLKGDNFKKYEAELKSGLM